jgi:hypothetical protein
MKQTSKNVKIIARVRLTSFYHFCLFGLPFLYLFKVKFQHFGCGDE